MFNVDFQVDAKRVFQRYDQLRNSDESESDVKKSESHSNSDFANKVHKFDLFYDFENNVRKWLDSSTN